MRRHLRPLLVLLVASALGLLGLALRAGKAGTAQPGQAGGAAHTQPATAAAAARTATGIRPTARQPLRVAIYGDSLGWEAGQAFLDALNAGERVVVRTRLYGGTAICDWLEQMRADARNWRPQAVVVEFSGDTFTPCMRTKTGAPLTGAARDARYARDARQVVSIFSRTATRLYFVGYPISRGDATTPTADWNYVNTMYGELAARFPRTEFVDAGQAVEDLGHYADTLPCLIDEPCTGGIDAGGQPVNVVRAPDGIHFCPNGPSAIGGVTVPCSVWSSGAFRYGNAMAAPIVRDFGL